MKQNMFHPILKLKKIEFENKYLFYNFKYGQGHNANFKKIQFFLNFQIG